MTKVRTRDEAIASVGVALEAWSVNAAGALAQAKAAVLAAQSEVQAVLRKSASEVAAMEALLMAADDEQGPELQVRLARARDARAEAERASAQVVDVVSGVSKLERAHTTDSTSQVASARAKLSMMGSALDGYRARGTTAGGGGSRGNSAIRADGDSLSAAGFVELDVTSADFDDNPILDDHGPQGSYGKGGLRRADYRWAVQTWDDSVGPGVANGKTREDFAALDAQAGAMPLRRKADVYDLFLGSDRIRVDRRPDGSLDVVNGRHRLLIAKELGVKKLPGQIS